MTHSRGNTAAAARNVRLIETYDEWMRTCNWSPRTVNARRQFAAHRLDAWGLDGFTDANIQAYMSNPDFSRWTRSTYDAHLRAFVSWLVAARLLTTPPTYIDHKSPKRPKSKPRPLSDEDVRRVLELASGETRDMFLLGLLQGLRAFEIAKIAGEDVTPRTLYVVGKGSREDHLPVHDMIWEMAQRYPRQGPWFVKPSGAAYSSGDVSSAITVVFRALGIAGSSHRARHTYGTRLLRHGVNIREVQTLMRHASLETTAAYVGIDEDSLQTQINRLPAA